MAEVIALRLPLHTDLHAFSAMLWQARLPHRVVEDRGAQVLWVASEEQAEQVKTLYQQFESGELKIVLEKRPVGSPAIGGLRLRLQGAPAVVVLLVLSLIGAAIPWLDRGFEVIPWLSFYQLSLVNGEIQGQWPVGQLWRLITPAFLHFGLLHIAFNSLWLWELGGMIERRQGSIRVLGLVLLIAAGSNIAQAIASVSLFGGMSGVIYGLLGYILVWNQLRPAQLFPLPKGVAIVMLVWLLLCIFGFAYLLGVGDIANTAHVSGLVLGAVLGGAAALLDRKPD